MIGGGPVGTVALAGTPAVVDALALDGTANGNHGVYIGAPEYVGIEGPYEGERAVSLDGVDDLIEVRDSASLDLVAPMALAGWVHPLLLNHAGGGSAPRIISKRLWNWWFGVTGGMGFGMSGATPTQVNVASAVGVNAWTHVGVEWDGAVVRFYKGGVQVGADQAMVGTGLTDARRVFIGDYDNDTIDRHWNGGLAHLCAFNKILGPQRMAALAARPFKPYENMLRWSEDLSNAVWATPQAGYGAATTLAPDKVSQVNKFVGDNGVAGSSKYANQNTVEDVAGGTVMLARVYAKAAEFDRLLFYILGVTDANYLRVTVNLATATFSGTFLQGTATFHGCTVTAQADGWYEIVLMGDPDLLNTGIRRFRVLMLNAAGTSSYTGDGVSGMYLWGGQLHRGFVAVPYVKTTSAAVAVNSYAEDVAVSGAVAYWRLTEKRAAVVTVDQWARQPIQFAINGASWSKWIRVDSLKIDDTLGQPMKCSFVIVNPVTVPRVGDVVRALYFSEVMFAGIITQAEPTPTTDLSVIEYKCDCTDWSLLLTRRRVRRNFINAPLLNVVDSLLDNELAGDGLSIGTIDQGALLPLVDVRNAKAFDVLRDIGGATGQAMFVDHAKAIQFRSTTNEPAPKVIDYSVVEASSMVEDLQTYRNVQTVIVTGTAASGEDEKSVQVQRTNDDQIAQRQEIEGGSGRYEDIEEITHPTSNLTADLQLLGISYARLRLATSGTPRKTVRVRVRGYGYRAGQVATVDLPALGVSGSWMIQRCSFREQAGQFLVYQLELTQSSRQQRAYEAWLGIVRAGKVTVQVPAALTSNLETFDTPGTFAWVSPITGPVEFTCIGASGGGGGSTAGYSTITGCIWTGIRGGQGGAGGFAVATIDAIAGQEYTIVIGAAGLAGAEGSYSFAGHGRCFGYSADPTDGGSASVTQAKIGTTIYCQADAGGGGLKTANSNVDGAAGSSGGGIGDAVTTGGGRTGGVGGVNGTEPSPGQDGKVEIRW